MIAFNDQPIIHPLVVGEWYYIFRSPNPDPKSQAMLGSIGKLSVLSRDGSALLELGHDIGRMVVCKEMVIPTLQMGHA